MSTKQIFESDDLEVGKFYFVRKKNTPTSLPFIAECLDLYLWPDGVATQYKYFHDEYLQEKVWATPDNMQAFERWDIFGPLRIKLKISL